MAEKRVQRRLAAILAADVVGYSRLVESDEEGTLARLKRIRKEFIEPKISEYGGRTVKLMGDGALVEFPSAIDAVRCAIELQGGMDEQNATLPDDQRIIFRIGINLGDIVIDGEDILGDGVNIAARLEGLTEPGGICVSGKVHEEVRGKIDIGFDDLGAQQVKNIAHPIQTYRIALGSPAPVPDEAKSALVPPDKPSIAVLPFDNMSGDPEQEYFADGIAEDIITALSHFRWFYVIARNSSFTYKGRAVDVRTVGRELGTRYVLEGRPVIVVRSFSKSAGLANLRVGYGIAHPELIEYLLHTVLPFNTGAPVIQAAIASMDDDEFKQRSRKLVEDERDFLFSRLRDLGLNSHPSQSNSVWVTDVPGGGHAFAEKILGSGVIVRPMAAFGEPDAIRVTVGTREKNERLLKAVSETLEIVGEG